MTSQELKVFIHKEEKIELILESIGCHSIKFHPENDTFMAAHPQGDNPAGVVIKNNQYLNYYSYSRNIHIEDGKDIISLVQEVRNVTFIEAMKYIHSLLGEKYTFSRNYKKENDEDVSTNTLAIFEKHSCKKKVNIISDFTPDKMDESIIADLMPIIHIDIFKEGIVPKTIKKFGLCYSFKLQKTIFPIRWWVDGSLLAYNARTSVENYKEFGIPKYYITPGYKKENNLYGLWENYNDILKAKYITLVESEKSVCKRDSRLDSTCVALQGHSISDEQVRIILEIPRIQEIIISLDKDVPINEVRHICSKFFRCRKVSYIKDKWNLLGEKDSPADAHMKIYDFLFKKRIVYTEKEHQLYLKSLEKKEQRK